jgi:hypothetical protein
MSHGDTVFSIPAHYEVLASTENCPVAAFRYKKKPITVCSGIRKLCTQKKEPISTRITNEVSEVTRVVYDITHKPPATIGREIVKD